MLGAGPVRTFWSVTLPALRPALVAAGSIVFLFCFTSFGVILVLGGPTFATLETEIYRRTAELLDLRTAAVLSSCSCSRSSARSSSRASWPAAPGAGASRRSDRVRLRTNGGRAPRRARGAARARARRRARWSSSSGARSPTAPSAGRGSATSRRASRASPLHAITTSLGIAVAATVIAVTLGLALATAVTRRRRSRLGRVGEVAVVLPLGVSAVTVGFGFLIVFDTPPLDLRTSWWIVPIAHALIALPFVVRTAVPAAARHRPAPARGRGAPRRVAAPRLAGGRPARDRAGRGGRRRLRVRDLARRVRRHAVHRPARDHHGADRDLPVPRPSRRHEQRPGVRARHDPDGRSPRDRASPATASTPAPGGTDAHGRRRRRPVRRRPSRSTT